MAFHRACCRADKGGGTGCRHRPRANLSGSRYLTSRPVISVWGDFMIRRKKSLITRSSRRGKTLAWPTKQRHRGTKMAPFSWPNTYRRTSFNQTWRKYFTYCSLYHFNVPPKQPGASHILCVCKKSKQVLLSGYGRRVYS